MLYYLTDSVLNQTSAAFRVGGPDANTYLQGQFTQDLNRPIGTVSYGLFLNQKGKVMADAYILRIASDDFFVVSFATAARKLRERLEAYLIADEVTILDETENWKRISLWGDQAEDALGKLSGMQPPSQDSWSEARNGWVFWGRLSAGNNFEFLVPRDDFESMKSELLATGAPESDVVAAAHERISSGIPAVPVDIGPADLPNEGGLETAAISYTKGCYLGQEVMARLKNLGQVRRHLYIVRGTGQGPATGASLFQEDEKIGEIRSVAPSGDGFVAMAMLSLVKFDHSRPLRTVPGGMPDINIFRRV